MIVQACNLLHDRCAHILAEEVSSHSRDHDYADEGDVPHAPGGCFDAGARLPVLLALEGTLVVVHLFY
jgi:hypothetical protein